jgi:hypothetical protein
MKLGFAVGALLVVSPPASAKWELQGSSSNFPSMAVDAKVQPKQIPARLQIECPSRSEPSGMSLAVALDYNIPKSGAVGWSIQIDGGETWRYQEHRFLHTTHIQIAGPQSKAFEALKSAKRLRLTLQPTVGEALRYDFDVSGGSVAIAKLDCPIKRF